MEGLKTYVAERSKAFAAGISTAVITAIIKHFEVSFGIDIPDELEILAISALAGYLSALATFWAPANKPIEPKQ